MSLTELRASVIIPIYNRSDELKTLLSSLIQQSLPASAFEILICDDGSTENIQSIVQEFQSPDKPAIKYFKQTNQGPGAARNLGLSHSRGAIASFTDTDCIPDINWLEELITPIESSNIKMTGGLIDYKKADFLSGRCMNFLMSSMIGAGGARDPRSIIHMKYFPRAANVAVSRDTALAAGGFPAQRHGEDIEFADRVRQQGAEILFVPTAKTIHNEQKTLKQLSHEAYLKGGGKSQVSKDQRHARIDSCRSCFLMLVSHFPDSHGHGSTKFVFLVFHSADCLPMFNFCFINSRGICLKDILAVFVIFPQAILMHISYGCGYLIAQSKLFFAKLKLNLIPAFLSTENKKF